MSTSSSPYSTRPARTKRAVSAASFASTEEDDIKPTPNKRRLTEIELEPRVDSGGDPAIRKAERKLRNRRELLMSQPGGPGSRTASHATVSPQIALKLDLR
jgi:hypothetical protein